MSKVSPKRRQFNIRKKSRRRKKLKKLKERYSQVKTKKEKERIVEKIKRISPYLAIEEILKIKKEEDKK